jgi:hypothetical protein
MASKYILPSHFHRKHAYRSFQSNKTKTCYNNNRSIIKQNTKKEMSTIITLGKYLGTYTQLKVDLENNQTYKRGACFISVTDNNGDIYYVFPVQPFWEKNANVIRDFGGTRDEGECVLDTAIREFGEESLYTFDKYITPDLIENARVYSVINNSVKNLLMVFNVQLEASHTINDLHQMFERQKMLIRNSYKETIPSELEETVHLVTIERKQFLDIIDPVNRWKNVNLTYDGYSFSGTLMINARGIRNVL